MKINYGDGHFYVKDDRDVETATQNLWHAYINDVDGIPFEERMVYKDRVYEVGKKRSESSKLIENQLNAVFSKHEVKLEANGTLKVDDKLYIGDTFSGLSEFLSREFDVDIVEPDVSELMGEIDFLTQSIQ